MKVTRLDSLVVEREIIARARTIGICYEIVLHCTRSPNAGELIAISDDFLCLSRAREESLLPFDTQLIGVHPKSQFMWICSRTDSGPFWRMVAIAKYKLLVAEYWLKNQIFRQLYLSGMLVHPHGEEPSWKHLRLDWLLIASAIASHGLTVCSMLWLLNDGYWQSIVCLITTLVGWITVGMRRQYLIDKRDRELRAESLRSLFRFHGVTPTDTEFQQCLLELIEPSDIIARHRAQRIFSQRLSLINPCYYYGGEELVRCAVHPENYGLGMCNTKCPSFRPKDSQQKN